MPALDDIPPWRATLLAVPLEQRSASQRNLIRGLQLADLIKDELNAGVNPTLDDPRALKILLSGCEAELLGPFEFSGTSLLPEYCQENFTAVVTKMNELGMELLGLTDGGSISNPICASQIAAAVLAQLLVVFLTCRDRIPGNIELHVGAYADMIEDFAAALDDVLTRYGGNLTAATLKEAMDFFCSIGQALDPRGLDDVAAAVNCVSAFAAEAEHGTVPTWKVLGACNIYTLISRPILKSEIRIRWIWGIQMNSTAGKQLIELIVTASDACINLLERTAAAAEAEGDHALVAFALAKKIDFMLKKGAIRVSAGALRAMSDRAAAALAAARPWLPKSLRKAFDTRYVDDALSGVGDAASLLNHPWKSVCRIVGHNPGTLSSREKAALEKDTFCFRLPSSPPLRSCAQCGAQSRELMACAGCRATFYCAHHCQKLHWKAGHKVECAEIKAKSKETMAADEGTSEAAVAGEEASGAAGPSAPAAKPSATSPKKKNNKKNNKKNKGKKKGGK